MFSTYAFAVNLNVFPAAITVIISTVLLWLVRLISARNFRIKQAAEKGENTRALKKLELCKNASNRSGKNDPFGQHEFQALKKLENYQLINNKKAIISPLAL